jgi:hypothetical protein
MQLVALLHISKTAVKFLKSPFINAANYLNDDIYPHPLNLSIIN